MKLVNPVAAGLLELIPQDELSLKLSYGCSELEPDSLCFYENYIPIRELVPKNFTIVDCGCYQGAQCYYFKDHKAYYGIDNFDSRGNASIRYIPPLRFYADNTVHWVDRIQNFLGTYKPNLYLPPDETYFICSAVPDFEATELVYNTFPNVAVFYPGQQPNVKGIHADGIVRRQQELRDILYGKGCAERFEVHR